MHSVRVTRSARIRRYALTVERIRADDPETLTTTGIHTG
jgi:hypothetical protein